MKNIIVNRSSSTLGLLGIAFVVLKLTGVINWSWWLVTLPFWLPPAVAITILLLIVLVLGALVVFEIYKNTRLEK